MILSERNSLAASPKAVLSLNSSTALYGNSLSRCATFSSARRSLFYGRRAFSSASWVFSSASRACSSARATHCSVPSLPLVQGGAFPAIPQVQCAVGRTTQNTPPSLPQSIEGFPQLLIIHHLLLEFMGKPNYLLR